MQGIPVSYPQSAEQHQSAETERDDVSYDDGANQYASERAVVELKVIRIRAWWSSQGGDA